MCIGTKLAALVFSILVAGCTTSMQVQTAYKPAPDERFHYRVNPQVEVSEEALGILRARLDKQLGAGSQLASGGDERANAVEVTITSYRMRHGAVRAMVGIFAGTDNMESTVEVKDSKWHAIKGKFAVFTSNASAWLTSRGLIEDHADQIAQYLKTGKPD